MTAEAIAQTALILEVFKKKEVSVHTFAVLDLVSLKCGLNPEEVPERSTVTVEVKVLPLGCKLLLKILVPLQEFEYMLFLIRASTLSVVVRGHRHRLMLLNSIALFCLILARCSLLGLAAHHVKNRSQERYAVCRRFLIANYSLDYDMLMFLPCI